DVEDGGEGEVDAEAAELPALDASLPLGEGRVAARAHGQAVGEDGHVLAQHDHAAALVVGRDEEAAAEGGLQVRDEPQEASRGPEVPAVEDEAPRAGLPEEPDVGVAEVGAGEAEAEPPADELGGRHREAGTGGAGAGRVTTDRASRLSRR